MKITGIEANKEGETDEFKLTLKVKYQNIIYKNKSFIHRAITFLVIFLVFIYGALIFYFTSVTAFPKLQEWFNITNDARNEIKEIIINVSAFVAGGIMGRIFLGYFSNKIE